MATFNNENFRRSQRSDLSWEDLSQTKEAQSTEINEAKAEEVQSAQSNETKAKEASFQAIVHPISIINAFFKSVSEQLFYLKLTYTFLQYRKLDSNFLYPLW